MRDERKYSAYPSDLDVLQAFIQLQDFFIECGYEEDTACCNNIAYKLKFNEFRELNAESLFGISCANSIPMPVDRHTHSLEKRK